MIEENKSAKKQVAWEIYKNTLRPIKIKDGQQEPFIMTRLGPFKVPDELVNPSKAFTMFIGHTNFIITEELATVIEETLGVEVLDILSPYRFRIAIGKMFETDEVKHNIVSNLNSVCVESITQTFLKIMNDGKDTQPT